MRKTPGNDGVEAENGMAENSLHILQVNSVDNQGGAARVAWNLHQAYKKRQLCASMAAGKKLSYESDVVQMEARYKAKPLYKRIQSKFSNISKCSFKSQRREDRQSQQEDLFYPDTWRLLQIFSPLPSIVHCHNLHGNYFDLNALPWLSQQAALVLTLHDAWLLSGHCAHSFDCERWKSGCPDCPQQTLYPETTREVTASNWSNKQKIYQKTQVYVATPCAWLMQKVEQSILAPAILQSKVIPNGIDLNIFYPQDKQEARAKLGLPLNAHILLFVSCKIKRTLYRDYKMLEGLISNLAYRHRQNLRASTVLMLCVGEEAQRQEQEKEKSSGNAKIRFIPFQRDLNIVAQYYQAADIFLFPSSADTFPLTILEALACGLPVVATKVGGIPEQIENGKNGFLVAQGDVRDMAEKTMILLNNKNLWRIFSQRAAQTAAQRFDLNHQAETYLSWYQEILAERSA